MQADIDADVVVLADCIRACAAARDGRGRWRVEQATAAKLARAGEPAGVSAMQAAAARRLGEWLAGQGLPAGTAKEAGHAA